MYLQYMCNCILISGVFLCGVMGFLCLVFVCYYILWMIFLELVGPMKKQLKSVKRSQCLGVFPLF